MVIRLSPSNFTFQSAEAWLLRTDWSRIPSGMLSVEHGHCQSNVIDDLRIDSVGVYNLWLSEISLKCLATEREVSVTTSLFPWQVNLTDEDLHRGEVTVDVAQDSLFRVTIIDRYGARVPHRAITFFGNFSSSEIQSDENGTIVLLDNPTLCQIDIPQDVGILLERLDL